MSASPTGPLMTAAEIYRLYRVPTGTLWDWRSKGRICKYGSHRCALYDPAEVEQLVALFGRRVS